MKTVSSFPKKPVIATIMILILAFASYYLIRKHTAQEDIIYVKEIIASNNDWFKDNEANRFLIESMKFDPSNSDSFFLYATMLHNRGDFDRAIEYYQKAIDISPDSIKHYSHRSQCYSTLKNYKKAIIDISKCIEINPSSMHYYFTRARLYGFSNNRIAAIKDYDEIINRENPNNPKYAGYTITLNNKAYSLMEMGKYYEALPLINKAIELNKEDDTFFGTRGELYYAVEDYDKSYNDFSRAIKIFEANKGQGGGDDPSIFYYYRGLLHARLGLTEAARLDLQKAVDMGSVKAAAPLHQVEQIIGKSLIENI